MKYCPIVRDWIEAGTALDKFGCFRLKKGGKIYTTLEVFEDEKKDPFGEGGEPYNPIWAKAVFNSGYRDVV